MRPPYHHVPVPLARAALKLPCAKSSSTPLNRRSAPRGRRPRLLLVASEAADGGTARLRGGCAGSSRSRSSCLSRAPAGRPWPRVRCAPGRRCDVRRSRSPAPAVCGRRRRRFLPRCGGHARRCPGELRPRCRACRERLVRAPRLDRRLELPGGVRRCGQPAPGRTLLRPRPRRLGADGGAARRRARRGETRRGRRIGAVARPAGRIRSGRRARVALRFRDARGIRRGRAALAFATSGGFLVAYALTTLD